MTRILLVGYEPESVDYSLRPGMTAAGTPTQPCQVEPELRNDPIVSAT